MARSIMLHYLPGSSFLHKWDTRCKFVALMIVTISLLHMREPALILFSCLFLAAFSVARLPWKPLLLSTKPWLLFLVVIFVAQVLSQQGSPWTLEAVKTASIVCWRLALMLAYAILFTSVTKPREMQDAIAWFLNPVPFLPARRIAMMVSLTVKFLPLILDQFDEVQLALKSRKGKPSRTSLGRLKFLFLPLFRRFFIRSDEIAFALAARGYREDLPVILPRIPLLHMLALVMLAAISLASTQAYWKWLFL